MKITKNCSEPENPERGGASNENGLRLQVLKKSSRLGHFITSSFTPVTGTRTFLGAGPPASNFTSACITISPVCVGDVSTVPRKNLPCLMRSLACASASMPTTMVCCGFLAVGFQRIDCAICARIIDARHHVNFRMRLRRIFQRLNTTTTFHITHDTLKSTTRLPEFTRPVCALALLLAAAAASACAGDESDTRHGSGLADTRSEQVHCATAKSSWPIA